MENILILIGLVILLIILLISTGSKFTYIKNTASIGTADNIVYIFFAPWCGHCKSSEDLFDRLNTEFDNVYLVNSDSKDQVDKDLLIKYQVKGFPTIKNSKNIEFNKDRTYENLVEFIQKS
jgi:thiol-disulfide isomerase/thioredoxin